jgi:hypothetical protein
MASHLFRSDAGKARDLRFAFVEVNGLYFNQSLDLPGKNLGGSISLERRVDGHRGPIARRAGLERSDLPRTAAK